jgi:hypothetical protein
VHTAECPRTTCCSATRCRAGRPAVTLRHRGWVQRRARHELPQRTDNGVTRRWAWPTSPAENGVGGGHPVPRPNPGLRSAGAVRAGACQRQSLEVVSE